ncbi:VIP36-like protein [Parus major]|uniref:VIP36-like protein n=1 Tax=Parus major TaxID=9157 RepID=UPI00144472AB|nr:VIP36-like protein [Parus major]
MALERSGMFWNSLEHSGMILDCSGTFWNVLERSFPLQPCYLRDWEMQVHFKIHGQGKKNLNGDGFAIWYTKDRMQPGPVFGSKDNFLGLGVFVDTYPNEEKQQEVRHGLFILLFLLLFILLLLLLFILDNDGIKPWDEPGINQDEPGFEFWDLRLPPAEFPVFLPLFPDNHDIISLKLYQLTVERTPEEEKRDREVFLPVVDNLRLPGSEWGLGRVGGEMDPGFGVMPEVWAGMGCQNPKIPS